MKWLKNFERVQEIQRHLVWPSVTDLDPRAFIPEVSSLPQSFSLLDSACELFLHELNGLRKKSEVSVERISVCNIIKKFGGSLHTLPAMLLYQ